MAEIIKSHRLLGRERGNSIIKTKVRVNLLWIWPLNFSDYSTGRNFFEHVFSKYLNLFINHIHIFFY